MRKLSIAMDKLVSLNDLRTFFEKQLVSHKNIPVYVARINEEKVARAVNLLTQKTFNIENVGEIIPLPRRIGNVNIDGGVIYVQRQPVRVMQMGVNGNNTKASCVPGSYLEGRQQDDAKRKLFRFDCLELGEAVMDNYPTLKECIKHVKEFGGGMAFDKQFTITDEFHIYYRTARVGKLPKTCSTVERIEFEEGFKHLSILLGGAYAKDLAEFGESCPC